MSDEHGTEPRQILLLFVYSLWKSCSAKQRRWAFAALIEIKEAVKSTSRPSACHFPPHPQSNYSIAPGV